jgi:hypothetical protein
MMSALVGRTGETPQGQRHDEASDDQVHARKVQRGSHEKDKHPHNDTRGRGDAAQFAEYPRRGVFVEILKGEGHIGGFKVVKPEAHHQGGQGQAREGGKPPGSGNAQSQKQD